jgi:hypothetical protein
MLTLISTRLVERVAVRSIAKRGSFISNGRGKNAQRCIRNGIPFRTRNPSTRLGRMRAGSMQNLGRIHIPDARHGTLIEKRHLHSPLTATEPLAKNFAGHNEAVRTDFVRPECVLKFFRRKQANISQPATVPIQKLANPVARQPATKPQVLASWRIRNEHEPCHPRFHHDRILRIQVHDDTLPNPTHIRHGSPHDPSAKPINTRRNLNRAPPTRNALHILNPRTDNAQYPPPHRLDFR